MTGNWIAEEVVSYFAASPIGPQFEVSRVAQEQDHPVSRALREAIALAPECSVASVLEGDYFRWFYGHLSNAEQLGFARESIVVDELHRRIRRRRRACLLAQHDACRPAPYDEPGLADVPVSEDRLVPLSEFDVQEGTLIRNGRAYVILPPIPAENSSYWITRALVAGGLKDQAWVRLDPLMRGPADEFPQICFKMLWWGPPLLWKDIENIHVEGFGRWAPGRGSNGGEFTDFAWVPRGDELHLFLEEMPKPTDVEIAGSRYFHVIFSRNTRRVLHLDGATRVYTASEWASRMNVHVHRTGKVGTRVKVFRIDHPIEPDAVSSLGGTYFVWNYDVAHFFDPSFPEWLLGTVGQQEAPADAPGTA